MNDQLLSVGNVITIGLQIYLSRLKLYFRIALAAHLWLLIPVYGWARFFTLSALISRLAIGELIDKTESPKFAQKQINSRFWSFLAANVLVAVIMAISVFSLFITALLILYVFLQNSTQILQSPILNVNKSLFFVTIVSIFLVSLATVMFFIIAAMLLYSRFFLIELMLAMEDNMSSAKAVWRSWNLTQGFEFRIQWIVTVAFLISLPIEILVQIIIEVIDWLLSFNPKYSTLAMVAIFLLVLLASAFMMPFWQSIKAVLYYDLRDRKEGLSLQKFTSYGYNRSQEVRK